MKAVAKTAPGKGNMEVVVDAPRPQIKDNEVLVEVRAAGLCGTDVSFYD